ncbi:hypothetical protein [Microbacterium rhizomatis]|uniref:Uncharacterized protein n=1 Tax=Microbacterium rhizomatis TaxID=1631477 RepID=A0A5J5J3V0_9MICO|nr:hypothetical protein [Microbacterium rhizomatis]KAA9108150.1 hypothetical protein F6B43_12145 [Microbacterium rhizomatis]
MNMESADRRGRPGLSEPLLLITQGLVAAVAVFFVYQVGAISPGCSPGCNYELFNQINHVFRWIAGLLFCAALIVVIVFAARGRRSRWAPTVGIILTIAAAMWAIIAGFNAFAP